MIAFHRQIDSETIQFEDTLTGQLELYKTSDFLRKVTTGTYKICGADDGDARAVGIRLSDAKKAEVMVFRLNALQKAEWQRKCDYVSALRKHGVQKGQHSRITQLLPGIAKRLADPSPPSAWTVMKWLKKFEYHGADMLCLVSGNAVRQSPTRLDDGCTDLIRRFLRKHYFIRNGESLRRVYRRILVEDMNSGAPRRNISESTVRRIAGETSPYHRDRTRYGPAFAAAKWRHSTGGIYATRPMQRIEMDHTTLDLYVLDDKRGIPIGRPTLTMLIDSYSFYILSIYISFEGGTTARMANAIKFALQPKSHLTESLGLDQQWLSPGLWETLVIDNALEFHSHHARSMSMELSFDLEYCPVRKPWFKAYVERAMLELVNILPIPGRPEKAHGIKDIVDPKIKACVTFSDLCRAAAKWATDVHSIRISDRTISRPIDLMLEGLATMPPPVYVDDLRSLDVIGGISKSARVNHSGIELLYLTYRSRELAAMAKEIAPAFSANIKINPDDLGSIWVQHPADKTWINVPATNSSYATGLTLFQHKLIRNTAKEKLKAMGAPEAFLKAEAELQNIWDEAIRSGKKLKMSTKELAALEGMRSSKVFAEDKKSEPASAEQVITRKELVMAPAEIPDFESTDLATFMR